jgi:hypothetical protein
MPRNKKNSVDPSPLPMRICECGCENEFQPTRSDQVFLNKKHYDYFYNKGPRKEKYAEEINTTKVIRKNDRILEKYFKLFDEIRVKMNLVLVKADGFQDGLFTRVLSIKKAEIEMKYLALYKYCYRIFRQGDVDYIEIREL